MEDALNVLIDYRSVFVALLLWAIMYAILITKGPFKKEGKINAGIAALAAIIVSLSGVVAYAVSYLFSFFGILIVALFVIAMILSFLEIDLGDLNLNGRVIAGVLVVLFLGILVNAFFGVNNEFELETFNEHEYQTDVDTTANIGFGEVEEVDLSSSGNAISDFFSDIDEGTWSAFVFLIIVGVFVIVFAK